MQLKLTVFNPTTFAPAHYLVQSVLSLAILVRDMSGIARLKPEALVVTVLCRMSGRFLPG